MAIYISKSLRQSCLDADIEVAEIIEDFGEWKASGDPNSSYLFGRDTPYAEPVIDGQALVLMHTHLIPLIDSEQMKRWDRVWKRRGEKKSDRALIYAQSDEGDFLLIHVLNEPGAHERARKDMSMMRHFTRLAIRFRDGDLSDCQAAA